MDASQRLLINPDEPSPTDFSGKLLNPKEGWQDYFYFEGFAQQYGMMSMTMAVVFSRLLRPRPAYSLDQSRRVLACLVDIIYSDRRV